MVPKKEFLVALLDGAEQLWRVLLNHKVFEGNRKRQTTPSDYPVQKIEEIMKLRERVKLMN